MCGFNHKVHLDQAYQLVMGGTTNAQIDFNISFPLHP